MSKASFYRNNRPVAPMRKRRQAGGEGGIRTPDRLAPMPHFECGAFDHSATSPGAMTGDSLGPRSGRVLGEDGGPGKARGQEIRAGPGSKKEPKMEHLTVQANGAAFHVARMGAGRPLLLLHGW